MRDKILGQFLPSFMTEPALRLESETLYLRPYRVEDFEQWSNARLQGRDYLQPFEPFWRIEDCTEAAFRLRVRHFQDEARAGRMFCFLSFCKKSDALVGGVSLLQITRKAAQNCFIGYWCAPDYLRQGRTREAVARAIDFAFHDLDLYRVQASCMPENHASLALLKSLNFAEEGLARNYLEINGHRRDHLLLALCRE